MNDRPPRLNPWTDIIGWLGVTLLFCAMVAMAGTTIFLMIWIAAKLFGGA